MFHLIGFSTSFCQVHCLQEPWPLELDAKPESVGPAGGERAAALQNPFTHVLWPFLSQETPCFYRFLLPWKLSCSWKWFFTKGPQERSFPDCRKCPSEVLSCSSSGWDVHHCLPPFILCSQASTGSLVWSHSMSRACELKCYDYSFVLKLSLCYFFLSLFYSPVLSSQSFFPLLFGKICIFILRVILKEMSFLLLFPSPFPFVVVMRVCGGGHRDKEVLNCTNNTLSCGSHGKWGGRRDKIRVKG